MSTTNQAIIARIMGDFYDAIEQAYYDAVREAEGRVPTVEEIVQHGHRFIGPDGKTTLTWKDIPVVEWDAMPMNWSSDGSRAVITFSKLTPNH